MFDILQFDFFQKALIAGMALAALLALLGIFVVLKKMSFFGDGIAHASLAGIAIAVLAGLAPLPVALLFGVGVAVLIYILEKKTNLATDAIIGIIFAAGMALGVVLMSLQSGYQPELISFLFGNILAVSLGELALMLVLTAVVIIFLVIFYKKLTLISLDEETAQVAGIKVPVFQLLFYVALAVAVVLGIKILGVILVSALLILPVATAKIFCQSFKKLIIASLIISEITVVLGIFLSYFLDLPTGAVIVLTGTILFVLVMIIKNIGSKI